MVLLFCTVLHMCLFSFQQNRNRGPRWGSIHDWSLAQQGQRKDQGQRAQQGSESMCQVTRLSIQADRAWTQESLGKMWYFLGPYDFLHVLSMVMVREWLKKEKVLTFKYVGNWDSQVRWQSPGEPGWGLWESCEWHSASPSSLQCLLE